MGFQLGGMTQAKHKLRRTLSPRKGRFSKSSDDRVPKGHLGVYVSETYRRFVIPVCHLNHPLFQELLQSAEEEFGYDPPTGGLTLPCSEDYLISLTSMLDSP